MKPETQIPILTQQFRQAHRRSLPFSNSHDRVCYEVEPTYRSAMKKPFDQTKARFTQNNHVYAGFYKTSLTVNIQVANYYDVKQLQAQTALQELLSQKQTQGELANVTVLVKNPLMGTREEAPWGWKYQNMLVAIDGQIFVATDTGVIVRPLTDTSDKVNPDQQEAEVTRQFLQRKAEIDESALSRWDTTERRPV